MKLTPENVYQYLYKRKTIDEAAAVKGNFMVHPVATRNTIMKLLIGEENSLFVKQMETDPMSNGLFKREVFTLQLFKSNTLFSSIASYVPNLIDFDDDHNVMVTRLIPNSMNLNEHYMYSKTFDANLAEDQAKILSECHLEIDKNIDNSFYPRILPWVLQLDKFQAHEFFVNNEFSAKIIKLIKDNDLLINALKALASNWKYTHLIHGDIKWINFLIHEKDGKLEQKLIDWELADIGDPLWDVAGLIQSYITAWLLGFDNSNPHNQNLMDNMKSFDIVNMQSSVQAFLNKYIVLNNYNQQEKTDFLVKTIQLAAVRIIQTSVESVTYLTKIEANNMRSIQLAFNILKDPLFALNDLFNIKTEAYV